MTGRLPASVLLATTLAATANAAVVSLPAVHDNTLYQDPAGTPSNGAGPAMFAGLNAQSLKRRAVVMFDVAGTLPQGAIITNATLRLYNSATNADARAVSLHRLLESWGEGASNAGASGGGGGTAAAPGDATWLHRFYPSTNWSQAGGAFAAAPLAQQTVIGAGWYDWSGPLLTADVASFLSVPASNFGWLLLGDETAASSSKRFATREEPSADRRPQLIVEFIPAPSSGAVLLACSGLAALKRRRR
jgi:hypothetical protein